MLRCVGFRGLGAAKHLDLTTAEKAEVVRRAERAIEAAQALVRQYSVTPEARLEGDASADRG